MIIYLVTNRINGKSYVGQTKFDLEKRKRQHINVALASRDNSYFHKAIKKHNQDNFDWVIIHDDITDIESLNKLEIFYIGYYDTFENGYNLTEGGLGHKRGYKYTKETKRKMSESHKGKKNHMYGKHLSNDQKRRLSEINMGKKHSEKSKRKMSMVKKGMYCGKNHSQARVVIINNKRFDTLNDAAEFVGMTPTTIRRRILHQTKWLDYKYA